MPETREQDGGRFIEGCFLTNPTEPCRVNTNGQWCLAHNCYSQICERLKLPLAAPPEPSPEPSQEPLAATGTFEGFPCEIRRDLPPDAIILGTKAGAHFLLRRPEPSQGSVLGEVQESLAERLRQRGREYKEIASEYRSQELNSMMDHAEGVGQGLYIAATEAEKLEAAFLALQSENASLRKGLIHAAENFEALAEGFPEGTTTGPTFVGSMLQCAKSARRGK